MAIGPSVSGPGPSGPEPRPLKRSTPVKPASKSSSAAKAPDPNAKLERTVLRDQASKLQAAIGDLMSGESSEKSADQKPPKREPIKPVENAYSEVIAEEAEENHAEDVEDEAAEYAAEENADELAEELLKLDSDKDEEGKRRRRQQEQEEEEEEVDEVSEVKATSTTTALSSQAYSDQKLADMAETQLPEIPALGQPNRSPGDAAGESDTQTTPGANEGDARTITPEVPDDKNKPIQGPDQSDPENPDLGDSPPAEQNNTDPEEIEHEERRAREKAEIQLDEERFRQEVIKSEDIKMAQEQEVTKTRAVDVAERRTDGEGFKTFRMELESLGVEAQAERAVNESELIESAAKDELDKAEYKAFNLRKRAAYADLEQSNFLEAQADALIKRANVGIAESAQMKATAASATSQAKTIGFNITQQKERMQRARDAQQTAVEQLEASKRLLSLTESRQIVVGEVKRKKPESPVATAFPRTGGNARSGRPSVPRRKYFAVVLQKGKPPRAFPVVPAPPKGANSKQAGPSPLPRVLAVSSSVSEVRKQTSSVLKRFQQRAVSPSLEPMPPISTSKSLMSSFSFADGVPLGKGLGKSTEPSTFGGKKSDKAPAKGYPGPFRLKDVLPYLPGPFGGGSPPIKGESGEKPPIPDGKVIIVGIDEAGGSGNDRIPIKPSPLPRPDVPITPKPFPSPSAEGGNSPSPFPGPSSEEAGPGPSSIPEHDFSRELKEKLSNISHRSAFGLSPHSQQQHQVAPEIEQADQSNVDLQAPDAAQHQQALDRKARSPEARKTQKAEQARQKAVAAKRRVAKRKAGEKAQKVAKQAKKADERAKAAASALRAIKQKIALVDARFAGRIGSPEHRIARSALEAQAASYQSIIKTEMARSQQLTSQLQSYQTEFSQLAAEENAIKSKPQKEGPRRQEEAKSTPQRAKKKEQPQEQASSGKPDSEEANKERIAELVEGPTLLEQKGLKEDPDTQTKDAGAEALQAGQQLEQAAQAFGVDEDGAAKPHEEPASPAPPIPVQAPVGAKEDPEESISPAEPVKVEPPPEVMPVEISPSLDAAKAELDAGFAVDQARLDAESAAQKELKAKQAMAAKRAAEEKKREPAFNIPLPAEAKAKEAPEPIKAEVAKKVVAPQPKREEARPVKVEAKDKVTEAPLSVVTSVEESSTQKPLEKKPEEPEFNIPLPTETKAEAAPVPEKKKPVEAAEPVKAEVTKEAVAPEPKEARIETPRAPLQSAKGVEKVEETKVQIEAAKAEESQAQSRVEQARQEAKDAELKVEKEKVSLELEREQEFNIPLPTEPKVKPAPVLEKKPIEAPVIEPEPPAEEVVKSEKLKPLTATPEIKPELPEVVVKPEPVAVQPKPIEAPVQEAPEPVKAEVAKKIVAPQPKREEPRLVKVENKDKVTEAPLSVVTSIEEPSAQKPLEETRQEPKLEMPRAPLQSAKELDKPKKPESQVEAAAAEESKAKNLVKQARQEAKDAEVKVEKAKTSLKQEREQEFNIPLPMESKAKPAPVLEKNRPIEPPVTEPEPPLAEVVKPEKLKFQAATPVKPELAEIVIKPEPVAAKPKSAEAPVQEPPEPVKAEVAKKIVAPQPKREEPRPVKVESKDKVTEAPLSVVTSIEEPSAQKPLEETRREAKPEMPKAAPVLEKKKPVEAPVIEPEPPLAEAVKPEKLKPQTATPVKPELAEIVIKPQPVAAKPKPVEVPVQEAPEPVKAEVAKKIVAPQPKREEPRPVKVENKDKVTEAPLSVVTSTEEPSAQKPLEETRGTKPEMPRAPLQAEDAEPKIKKPNVSIEQERKPQFSISLPTEPEAKPAPVLEEKKPVEAPVQEAPEPVKAEVAKKIIAPQPKREEPRPIKVENKDKVTEAPLSVVTSVEEPSTQKPLEKTRREDVQLKKPEIVIKPEPVTVQVEAPVQEVPEPVKTEVATKVVAPQPKREEPRPAKVEAKDEVTDTSISVVESVKDTKTQPDLYAASQFTPKAAPKESVGPKIVKPIERAEGIESENVRRQSSLNARDEKPVEDLSGRARYRIPGASQKLGFKRNKTGFGTQSRETKFISPPKKKSLETPPETATKTPEQPKPVEEKILFSRESKKPKQEENSRTLFDSNENQKRVERQKKLERKELPAPITVWEKANQGDPDEAKEMRAKERTIIKDTLKEVASSKLELKRIKMNEDTSKVYVEVEAPTQKSADDIITVRKEFKEKTGRELITARVDEPKRERPERPERPEPLPRIAAAKPKKEKIEPVIAEQPLPEPEFEPEQDDIPEVRADLLAEQKKEEPDRSKLFTREKNKTDAPFAPIEPSDSSRSASVAEEKDTTIGKLRGRGAKRGRSVRFVSRGGGGGGGGRTSGTKRYRPKVDQQELQEEQEGKREKDVRGGNVETIKLDNELELVVTRNDIALDQEDKEREGGQQQQDNTACATCGTELPPAQAGNCPVCAQSGQEILALNKTNYRFSGSKMFAAADTIVASKKAKEIIQTESLVPLANLRYWPKIPGHREILQLKRQA